MSNQVLLNVRELASYDNKPERVVLSAVGLNTFIRSIAGKKALSAREIAAREMANLIVQLRNENVQVLYTDIDAQQPFWQQVRSLLKDQDSLTYAGAVPGNWIEDSDLIVNAASIFDHPGNGGRFAESMDSRFGDTVLFDAHVLMSIFHSVGLSKADLE